MRTVVAFLAAPLVVALAIALMNPSAWGFGAFLTIFYAYPVMIVAGLPVYFYFRRRGWLTLRHVTIAGAVAGALLPILIFSILAVGLSSSSDDGGKGAGTLLIAMVGFAVLGSGLGALTALVFGYIAFGRRPRGDAAQMPSNPSLERP